MATTPVWQAATSGQAASAGHVNQFLGTHAASFLYAGGTVSAQTTLGATSTSTNGLWLAQSFTTGTFTTAGWAFLPVSTTTTSGANLGTTTLAIYANTAGAPSGSALVSATITAEYANLATAGTATNFAVYPIPITGLTAATTYWLVLHSAGNVTNSYTWYRSNQVTGASTSPDGVTWTAQAYGLAYQVNDQSASGLLTATWEDSGARWTAYRQTNGTTGQITAIGEYTVGQTAAGYLQSYRNLTYTNGLLTGVA